MWVNDDETAHIFRVLLLIGVHSFILKNRDIERKVIGMKFTFSFKEINYGSVEIESNHTPDRAEVIDAIMSGNAYYKDTDYGDVTLQSTERSKAKSEREHER